MGGTAAREKEGGQMVGNEGSAGQEGIKVATLQPDAEILTARLSPG